jgi:hypothetical protein
MVERWADLKVVKVVVQKADLTVVLKVEHMAV